MPQPFSFGLSFLFLACPISPIVFNQTLFMGFCMDFCREGRAPARPHSKRSSWGSTHPGSSCFSFLFQFVGSIDFNQTLFMGFCIDFCREGLAPARPHLKRSSWGSTLPGHRMEPLRIRENPFPKSPVSFRMRNTPPVPFPSVAIDLARRKGMKADERVNGFIKTFESPQETFT